MLSQTAISNLETGSSLGRRRAVAERQPKPAKLRRPAAATDPTDRSDQMRQPAWSYTAREVAAPLEPATMRLR
jgi:hypothetical protein